MRGWMLASVVVLMTSLARADEAKELHADSAHQQPIVRTGIYRSPQGFNGHSWGKPLSEFVGFEIDPATAQVAYSGGKVTGIDMHCMQSPSGRCDAGRSWRTLRQQVEGQGFHALVEYHVESQGMQFPRAGVILFPVFYQFCARWGGFAADVPADIQQRLKLCGVRLMFEGETVEQLDRRDDKYPATYELLLRELIDLHGEPDDYRRNDVVVEASAERVAAGRDIEERRWCGLRSDRSVAPSCPCSIVLRYDRTAGAGVLLYATRATWEFAFASNQHGIRDEPLYALLHGVRKSAPWSNSACADAALCRVDPRQMSEGARVRFRLPAAEERTANVSSPTRSP
jgi:hypothetical protein